MIDRVLRVFDTSKGGFDCIRKIPARDVGWSILDTAFSPDGRNIIYSSWSEASKFPAIELRVISIVSKILMLIFNCSPPL